MCTRRCLVCVCVCVCLCSVCRGVLITSSHTCSKPPPTRSLIPPTPSTSYVPSSKPDPATVVACLILPRPSPPHPPPWSWSGPGSAAVPQPPPHPSSPPTAWSKQQQGRRWFRLIPRRDIHDAWPPSREHGPELLEGLMSIRTRRKVGFYTRGGGTPADCGSDVFSPDAFISPARSEISLST